MDKVGLWLFLSTLWIVQPGVAAQESSPGTPAEPSPEKGQTLYQLQLQIDQQNQRLRQLEARQTIRPINGSTVPVLADWPAPPGAACPLAEPGHNPGDSPPLRIGGQYRILYNGGNFPYHPLTLSEGLEFHSFANQRFRTWLTVSPNENVEGYLQVEMGHVFWGTNFEFPHSYVGPRFPPGDDRIGIELRQGYLTYQNEGFGRVRVGIQGWQDSFGQTLASADWDFNVGGVAWENRYADLGELKILAGFFVLAERGVQEVDDAFLYTLDVDWLEQEKSVLGGSVYFLQDQGVYSYPTAAPYASAWDLWVGLRASQSVGPVPLNGFALLNVGTRHEFGGQADFHHTGWAFKVEAGPVPIGPGTVSLQTLYASGGEGSQFRTIAQSVRDNFGAQGYWSYLALTSPHGPSDVRDLGLSLQNRGLGLFTLQGKYDYPIWNCLSGTSAVGWFRSDVQNPASGSSDIGTEFMQQFTVDLTGGLKVDLGAAFLLTGDFYRPSTIAARPDNLWELFCRMQLEF